MNNVIYQQDSALLHSSNVSLDLLNKYFPGDRLISERTDNHGLPTLLIFILQTTSCGGTRRR